MCDSRKCDKRFAYGRREPNKVVGTFGSEIVCQVSGEKCVDEFAVIQGVGKPLLGKGTTKKLKVF